METKIMSYNPRPCLNGITREIDFGLTANTATVTIEV